MKPLRRDFIEVKVEALADTAMDVSIHSIKNFVVFDFYAHSLTLHVCIVIKNVPRFKNS
jgi:hypothetical protein